MKNSSERAIHGFVQVGWYRPTSVFAVSIVYLKNKPPSGQKLLMSRCLYMYIASNNAMRAPSGSFVSQWHKKHAQLHTFYTNARILIPVMTFYDAKPQSVKTPVAAKPSGISPNHPCQCSLVILSCYLSPSHFFTADHL